MPAKPVLFDGEARFDRVRDAVRSRFPVCFVRVGARAGDEGEHLVEILLRNDGDGGQGFGRIGAVVQQEPGDGLGFRVALFRHVRRGQESHETETRPRLQIRERGRQRRQIDVVHVGAVEFGISRKLEGLVHVGSAFDQGRDDVRVASGDCDEKRRGAVVEDVVHGAAQFADGRNVAGRDSVAQGENARRIFLADGERPLHVAASGAADGEGEEGKEEERAFHGRCPFGGFN